jgi:F-type H+-transporting ATPase subunit b
MLQTVMLFAATEEATDASPLAALGVDGKSFIFQLITFTLVFLILKRFAFTPISKLLAQRRATIDDGVKMGLRMEKEKAKFDSDLANVLRDARKEADKIIATGHKEAREVVREAEKNASRKADSMMADAEARIAEESEKAKLKLEKDIVGLISEATEALVGQKVDPKADAEIIDKILRSRIK